MDLLVFGRVLWRFRVIVILGLCLSIMLAILSFMRVEFRDGRPQLTYRQAEIWQATTRLFLTQPGFPWGGPSTSGTVSEEDAAAVGGGRLYGLAVFYSELANSDAVQYKIFAGPTTSGSVSAVPVTDPVNGDALPFINIVGTATSQGDAIRLSRRGARVFAQYLAANQAAAGTPDRQRVEASVVNRAVAAALVQGRKKTAPMFVFLAVLVATLGLVFVLENVRPRHRLAAAPPPPPVRLPNDSIKRPERTEEAK